MVANKRHGNQREMQDVYHKQENQSARSSLPINISSSCPFDPDCIDLVASGDHILRIKLASSRQAARLAITTATVPGGDCVLVSMLVKAICF
ncbi:uncharacterized protein L3040_006858 [Drepanopeziza brunnea f. sp. 'multigermtubi']|uniref:uncharacterized protein n=1 Tax=Drepanopeziza brunnea f. sp. 'multigermtubi' TaxID=698441 RepID=UPI00238FF786|nr:hypothetical protein L3040_006858 [Drepanopeziza brunnea f. sp. 'multigermtubi']